MISYERIDRSEGIYFNKGEISVKCMICGNYYFKDIRFKYQAYVCNRCHDFSMAVINLSDFFILTIKTIDYRVYNANTDKKATLYFLNNPDLNDKGVL